MCYRKSVPGSEVLEKKFKAQYLGDPFKRRYNVSPFTDEKLPVITDDKPEQIQLFHWGLIPVWVKNKKQADEIQKRTANARSETIFEKPSFRYSSKKKHCLVLADGFFEWRHINNVKYPYYIRLKNNEPFAMAGLWDSWRDSESGETVNSYTIITTDANPMMSIIHNKKKRMPVILTKDTENIWLTDYSKEKALELLVSFDEKEMEAYTISKLITTRGRNTNVPEVIQPFNYPGINTKL